MTPNGNPFNLGMKLKGQDAINFHKRLEDPICTPEGIELLRQAKELADAQENEIPEWLKQQILRGIDVIEESFDSDRDKDIKIKVLEWVLKQRQHCQHTHTEV